MPGLSKAQQLFLQSFMSRGILVSQEVKSAFKLACRADSLDPEQNLLVDWVRAINNHLTPLHLEVKKAVSEQTGAQYYGLTSTAETDISRLSSAYSENEYEFFKKVIESVVESETGTVSSTDCLILVDQLERKMSKKDAQDLLARLREEGWLDMNKDGRVMLSTRCILEMDQYIHEQFPDAAIDCNVCNRLCVQGQLCERCDARLHKTCASRFFTTSTEPKCPNTACRAPWPHEVLSRPTREGGSPVKSPQVAEPPANPRKRKSQH